MSDVFPLSRISGLSFDSTLLSPLLFFLPSPVTLSVLSFFYLQVHSSESFSLFGSWERSVGRWSVQGAAMSH